MKTIYDMTIVMSILGLYIHLRSRPPRLVAAAPAAVVGIITSIPLAAQVLRGAPDLVIAHHIIETVGYTGAVSMPVVISLAYDTGAWLADHIKSAQTGRAAPAQAKSTMALQVPHPKSLTTPPPRMGIGGRA